MKKFPAFLIMALVTTALSGCVTSYIPPQSYSKEITRQYDHSYQESWDAVLDMITFSGLKLNQMSEDSGYISVTRRLEVDSDEADCGKFDAGGAVYLHTDSIIANVAIRFKELSGNRSQVSVFVTAERLIVGNSTWDLTYFEETYSCESTGKLERILLDYVEDRAG